MCSATHETGVSREELTKAYLGQNWSPSGRDWCNPCLLQNIVGWFSPRIVELPQLQMLTCQSCCLVDEASFATRCYQGFLQRDSWATDQKAVYSSGSGWGNRASQSKRICYVVDVVALEVGSLSTIRELIPCFEEDATFCNRRAHNGGREW